MCRVKGLDDLSMGQVTKDGRRWQVERVAERTIGNMVTGCWKW